MSQFTDLFGEECRGRPRNDEGPVGVPTGNPEITVVARRRATRVLRYLHREEFEQIMLEEAAQLMVTPKGYAGDS